MLYEKICSLATAYGVGVVEAADIDKYGATWANQTAFRRAIDSLQQTAPHLSGGAVRYLIDGILPLGSMKGGEAYITCVDGDAEYLSIAAASILAKVWHDRWVQEWCGQEVNKQDAERYNLTSCKGYGTAKHRAGLLQHGYTSLHRKLYLRKMFPDIQVERYHFIEE
jgi:ribonuclease HII